MIAFHLYMTYRPLTKRLYYLLHSPRVAILLLKVGRRGINLEEMKTKEARLI
jgi:hypothetical protein